MIVCRYFTDDFAVETLRKLSFKVTKPSELNDPFENSPVLGPVDEFELETHLRKESTIDYSYKILKTYLGVNTREEFCKVWEVGNMQKVKTSLLKSLTDGSRDALENEKKNFSNNNRIFLRHQCKYNRATW